MISVVANEADRAVAAEFFELFKTPWQFHVPGQRARVLLCVGKDAPAAEADLTIVFSGEAGSLDGGGADRSESAGGGAWFAHDGREFPIYGRALLDPASQRVVFRSGGAAARPIVRIGYDLFAEVRHLLTAGQPVEHAGIPALDLHIDFLRQLILSHGLPLVEIPPLPAGHEFIVCLTHDVDHVGVRNHKFDHTIFGFLYRATAGSVADVCTGRRTVRELGQNLAAALRLPLVHLGLARDFWYQFDQYTAIENGRPATYYVIPKKGEPGLDAQGRRPARRAASYDAADLQAILRRLESEGKEVTVHGLDAWRDTAAGREERERIGGLIGARPAGVRMHWLYFDGTSPEKLEAAGFSYDSTVGYNGAVGYRAGTTQVFKPLSTRSLLELPLHIMDTALFYPSHLNLSARAAERVVQPLIANAVRFGGVLTVNWHDRSLAPERLWGEFYRQLLERLQAANAWFATAAQAVAWFRRRRTATFSCPAGDQVQIRLPGAKTPSAPDLRVRVFRPGRPGTEAVLQDGWETHLAEAVARPALAV